MIEKKQVNLKNLIESITAKSDNAPSPKRFFVDYPEDDIMLLLGASYRMKVTERIPKEQYKPVSDEMRKKMEMIAHWLCQKEKRPGLLLYGNVGNGKTTMLKAICHVINSTCKPETYDNGRREQTLSGTSEVISIFRAKEIIENYHENRTTYDLMCKVSLLAIDELGVEPIETKLYGNANEPLIDLLSLRYDKQLTTIISSNLTRNEIGERYGKRLDDRFEEMFSTVSFSWESFRR